MSLKKYKLCRRLCHCPYTIRDIQFDNILNAIASKRSLVKIAIVDDKGFPELLKNALEKVNFRIVTFEKVESLNQFADYEVVISDVNGVAENFDEKLQGIALIKELSKLYPQKSFAVYSGMPQNLTQLPADVMVIHKDDDKEVWREKLDEMISHILNPVHFWKCIAKKLIDRNLPANVIAQIEDDYVSRIINKRSFDNFPDCESPMGTEAVEIIRTLLTKTVITLLIK